MISFNYLSKKEFDQYSHYFIADYSKEISENYGYSIERSVSQAELELQQEFPDGVAQPGNFLLSIQLTGVQQPLTIGYLWYFFKEKSGHAFICDFYILENYRNRGYGKAAIDALQHILLESGVLEIRLRVANTNPRALKLYKEIGFAVTGINMMKRLESN